MSKLELKWKLKKWNEKENRKDKRIKIEGTQQSEMISQRKNDGLPINFENQSEAGMNAFM
jgi:hypothetical protein